MFRARGFQMIPNNIPYLVPALILVYYSSTRLLKNLARGRATQVEHHQSLKVHRFKQHVPTIWIYHISLHRARATQHPYA